MSTTSKFILIFCIMLCTNLFPQSIKFVNPVNNKLVVQAGFGSTESTIPLNVSYSYTTTQSPFPSFRRLIKLHTHNAVYNSEDGIPQWFYLIPGTYTWTVELWEDFFGNTLYRTAWETITFSVKHTVFAKNNFGAGNIKLNNSIVPSGSSVFAYVGEEVYFGAIDQLYNGYNRVWNQAGSNVSYWSRQQKNQQTAIISNAINRDYSHSVQVNDNGVIFYSDLKKVVNLSFRNNFPGTSNPGVIKVNGSICAAPKTLESIEGDYVTYQVITPQQFDNVQYNFKNWDDGYTGYSAAVNSSSHMERIANFQGKALYPESIRNLTYDFDMLHRIILRWNEHPHPNVTQYSIWRKVQDNGVLLPPQQIAIVNRGTTSITDAWFKADPNGADVVWYDVRACFSPDGLQSDQNWGPSIQAKQVLFDKKLIKEDDDEIKYYTGSYPNPFNPVTTIEYHLPKDGHATIKVFNSIGKEILLLVDEEKTRGKYRIQFDGSSLASGLYFYELRIGNDFRSIQKMLLMK